MCSIYRRLIVFVVGGVTYEEFASVESLLQSPRFRGNFTALVGGSCIHNSTSFLREMGDLNSYKLSQREQNAALAETGPETAGPYRPQYQAASSSSSMPPRPQPQHTAAYDEYDDMHAAPPAGAPRHPAAAAPGPGAPRPAPTSSSAASSMMPPGPRGPAAPGRPQAPPSVNTRPISTSSSLGLPANRGPAGPGAGAAGAGAGGAQPSSARPAGPGRPIQRSSSGSLGLGE